MKFQKTNFEQGKAIIEIWCFINLVLNFLGVVVLNFMDENKYGYSDDFQYFLQTVYLQTILFSFAYILTFLLTKKKVISMYGFAFVQTLIFHSILFENLVKKQGELKIIASYTTDIMYLMYQQQGLLGIISFYYPLKGYFGEDSVFMPENTAHFYLSWIIMPLLYFFLITFLAQKILKCQQLFS